MRRFLILLALSVACPAMAAEAQSAKPGELQPLPELEAPPGMADVSPGMEPQVTIVKRGEDKVEEYRLNGRLYMIKVTPPHGVPYYLVDVRGDGQFMRRENIESGLRVPMWVIHSF